MPSHRPRFSIILAAGKGTRMRSADLHKVCFPIDGRPAINRALEVYKACGIEHHIIVVGAMANQVMETVTREHDQVIFAYQAEQLGTGHAARQGARVLEALRADEDVLIVVGDRLLEQIALERLIDVYYAEQCDMAFMVTPNGPQSESGRVLFTPDGSVLANVEVRDIWQRRSLGQIRQLVAQGTLPTREQARAILLQGISERRAPTAFGDLWQRLQEGNTELTAEEWEKRVPESAAQFAFTDARGHQLTFTPDQVDASPVVNVSVYLLKARVLHAALARLQANNAQREEYLPDIINILAQDPETAYRVRAVRIDNPNHVLAFNNPAELLQIEVYFQEKKRPQKPPELPTGMGFRPVSAWAAAIQQLDASSTPAAESPLTDEFPAIYGDQPELLDERRQAYLRLLDHAHQVLGPDCPVFIVRAPGRVNILGRHVDHQGGNCNLMAIDREILMAVHPRDDDQVNLHNVAQGTFDSRHFSIGDMLSRLPWDDWLSLVNSKQVQEMVQSTAGDWSQYVRAAILRLQKKFPTVKLRGMDMVVHGNIPIAAGLSSSSALVVATAEATVLANHLEVLPTQFVDLCGEGEWFVGTRGGSADHAAMKFGQKGKVAQVTFFEFGVEGMADFPSDYRMVICNSLIQARKSAGVRDIFNHRVACYRLGVQFVQARYRQYAPLIHHLRDINTRTLGIPLSWIYRILLSLPEKVSRAELAELLPPDVLAPLLATHAPTDEYPVRGVVLYGLAECERSRLAVDLLANGQIAELGRLMQVSHDGDRIVSHDAQGRPHPYAYQASNGYLLDLMADLESGDPSRVLPAQLQWQPGIYRCSTPEIDLMVDTALQVPGVLGAQLAGAGLGGCMMVLAHRDATDALARRMDEVYYAPRSLSPDISICTPIAGSGVLLTPQHTVDEGWIGLE